MKKNLFITFEGPEGSGKTTQLRRLARFLKGKKVPFIVTREPGGSRLSTHLRRWILNRLDYRLSPQAELFLFLADRAQHVSEVVKPALEKGSLVLCDRYTDSTLAYQGGGRGFPMDLLAQQNQAATGGLKPDLTLLFDVPVEVGLKRAAGRGAGKDKIESEKLQFHVKVRRTFLQLAKKEPRRFLVIDGCQRPEDVFDEMLKGLVRRLPLFGRNFPR